MDKKYISTIVFNDDTGQLSIRTSLAPHDLTDELYQGFLDREHPWTGPQKWPVTSGSTNYQGMPAEILIDTRTQKGDYNIVSQIFNGWHDGHAGDIHVASYSKESGRECHRQTWQERGEKNTVTTKHFDAESGEGYKYRDLDKGGAEKIQTDELGRLAPKIDAANITSLLLTLKQHGRRHEGAIYDRLADLGDAAREVYEVNKWGMKNGFSVYEKDTPEKYPLQRQKGDAAHLISMLVPTERLLRSFPWIQDIKATAFDDGPLDPSRRSPRAKALEFTR